MILGTADQIEMEAASWLERRLYMPWSIEDQNALDLWLATSIAHRIAYLRLEEAWRVADRLAALRPAPRKISTIWPNLRKAAASMAIIALLAGAAYQQFKPPGEDVYVTALGGHKIITFTDGTRVELNTDTVLRVSKNPAERKAWLEKGEAYFDVVHDASRPFIVVANGRRVTDLGTKFIVRQDIDHLSVAVVEGLVEVAAKDSQSQSLLKPGDVFKATDKTQAVSHKPLKSLIASLSWQYGKLTFDNTTLAEAIAEFNRYNASKLVISDPKIADLTIAGSFQSRNLETFTHAVRDVFGLKIEIHKTENQNDKIILTR